MLCVLSSADKRREEGVRGNVVPSVDKRNKLGVLYVHFLPPGSADKRNKLGVLYGTFFTSRFCGREKNRREEG